MDFHDITIWITKHCLSKGIFKKVIKENEIQDFKGKNKYVILPIFKHLTVGRDVFLTEEEALKNAELRKARRIKGLKSHITKLENLEIKIKES